MAKRLDPITGDEVTLKESVSLRAQAIMRSFWFFASWQVAVWAWMWLAYDPGHVKLNLALSYSALLFEQLIGIGMFAWARRDSQVLRGIAKLEEEQHRQSDIYDDRMKRIEAQNLATIMWLREIYLRDMNPYPVGGSHQSRSPSQTSSGPPGSS